MPTSNKKSRTETCYYKLKLFITNSNLLIYKSVIVHKKEKKRKRKCNNLLIYKSESLCIKEKEKKGTGNNHLIYKSESLSKICRSEQEKNKREGGRDINLCKQKQIKRWISVTII